jgi:hypothetical protein
MLREYERRVETTKMGPNDARRVVWTRLISFQHFFYIQYIVILCNYLITKYKMKKIYFIMITYGY